MAVFFCASTAASLPRGLAEARKGLPTRGSCPPASQPAPSRAPGSLSNAGAARAACPAAAAASAAAPPLRVCAPSGLPAYSLFTVLNQRRGRPCRAGGAGRGWQCPCRAAWHDACEGCAVMHAMRLRAVVAAMPPFPPTCSSPGCSSCIAPPGVDSARIRACRGPSSAAAGSARSWSASCCSMLATSSRASASWVLSTAWMPCSGSRGGHAVLFGPHRPPGRMAAGVAMLPCPLPLRVSSQPGQPVSIRLVKKNP